MAGSTGAIEVVIPTRNRSAMLATAISSVLQSPLVASPEQVVVVDDSSTDNTESVARSFGVRYFRITGNGPSRTRNFGLQHCTAEYVAFLDDDDLWLPGNLEPQLELMAVRPELAFVYGRSQMTTPDLQPVYEPFPELPIDNTNPLVSLVRRAPQLAPVLFRRDRVLEAGGFDEERPWGEDGDLMIRLAAKHPVLAIDSVGAIFRLRDPSRDDAEKRASAMPHYRALRRKWKRLRLPIPGAVLRDMDRRLRGMWTFWFCEDAASELRLGNRRQAFRYLWFALKTSPGHALLRLPRFWSTLGGLLRPQFLHFNHNTLKQ